ESGVSALRINIPRQSDITVKGENRADITADMHVIAHGFDPAEANTNAAAIKARIERVGDAMVVSLDFVPMRGPARIPPAALTIVLAVPQRLTLRMEPHFGRFVATNLASAELMGSRG